jgi:Protein of unknown function (DUF2950)
MSSGRAADAQNEYADRDRTGNGSGIYAQRIVSSPGQKDGLYWPSQGGSDESPLGEFAARASAQGYKIGSGPAPYHGYYYRILTRQGPHAAGGTLNYIVNGKMIGGFALVAYPAEYGNSGVMTFLVNHAGALFEKDLGPETAEIANRMTTFRPRSDLEKSKCGQRGQMSGGAASLICVGSLGYRAGGIVGNIRSRQSNSLGRLRRDGSRTGRIDSIADTGL